MANVNRVVVDEGILPQQNPGTPRVRATPKLNRTINESVTVKAGVPLELADYVGKEGRWQGQQGQYSHVLFEGRNVTVLSTYLDTYKPPKEDKKQQGGKPNEAPKDQPKLAIQNPKSPTPQAPPTEKSQDKAKDEKKDEKK